jgi:FKBP-type peptidyl-prolyl cis-trans isomerase FkpA
MKKIIFAVMCITLISSCLKKSGTGCPYQLGDPKASAQEILNIQTYLANNSINATQHSTGLFYTINNAGNGDIVTDLCNIVRVTYVGKLTNGTQFDASAAPVDFGLNQLITGWKIGIPIIKVGGSIRLFVPPSLGYGSQAVQGIPANSILVFDINLLGVQK